MVIAEISHEGPGAYSSSSPASWPFTPKCLENDNSPKVVFGILHGLSHQIEVRHLCLLFGIELETTGSVHLVGITIDGWLSGIDKTGSCRTAFRTTSDSMTTAA